MQIGTILILLAMGLFLIGVFVIAVMQYRNAPDPSPSLENAPDDEYDSDQWVYPNQPLKWIVRSVFTGLNTLTETIDFTPEDAQTAGVSVEDMNLLKTLALMFKGDLAFRRESFRRSRMMEMVNTALHREPENEEGGHMPYSQFFVDMADLGTAFFLISEGDYEIKKLRMHEFGVALRFIWNFLDDLDYELGGEADLNPTDFGAFDGLLTPEQVEALIAMIGIVRKVDTPDLDISPGDDDAVSWDGD